MYQHSPDRNAVFGQYSIPRDWSYNAKGKINSGMTLVGNRLLFTTFSHALVTLDVRDGHEIWRARLPNIAMSTPIVAGNMVYVGTGRGGMLDRSLKHNFNAENLRLRLEYGAKPISAVNGGDEIAAFDLRTGAPRWTYHTDGEDMPSAVYVDGKLILANGDWRAYALRADTGQKIWSTDLPGYSTMANAVTAGRAVVVGVCTDNVRSYATVALDPSTGKILWTSPYGHCDASPAYADGRVFVSSSLLPSNHGDHTVRRKPVVAALNAQTGRPIWVYRGTQFGIFTGVSSWENAIAGAYASGVYYQPAESTDELIAFDAATGKIRWDFRTLGPVKMSPVISNGKLYVGDTVGLLYTLDAGNGRLLEARAFDDAFTTTPPIVAGNKLLVVNGTTVYTMPLSGLRSDQRYYDDEAVADASK